MIRDNFELILTRYVTARMNNEAFGREHAMWGVFEAIGQTFSTSSEVKRRPTLRVRWSVGKGRWTNVPHITFLDGRETDTPQRGVYCVYLFRRDMSGVYLTFNQGVTELKNQFGRPRAPQLLRDRAASLRKLCSSLAEQGFRLDDGIDLRADRGLGSDYESSTIAYKFYGADRVPNDDLLFGDLEAVLSTYDRYLADEKWTEAVEACWHILSDRTTFDSEETEYKFGIAQQVREALDPTINPESFGQLLKRAFDNPHNNLTNWQDRERFTKWLTDNPELAQEAVSALLDQDRSIEERIDEFLQDIPNEAVSGGGTRISIASFLLMALDPATFPMYKPKPFQTVERVLNWPGRVEVHLPLFTGVRGRGVLRTSDAESSRT